MTNKTEIQLNLPAFERLKKFLKENPNAIEMTCALENSHYHYTSDEEYYHYTSDEESKLADLIPSSEQATDLVSCGTIGCIAGWTCAIEDFQWLRESLHLKPHAATWRFISDKASQILGITEEGLKPGHSIRLFHTHLWPSEYFDEYIDVRHNKPAVAQIIIKVIDYYLSHPEEMIVNHNDEPSLL